MKNVLVTGHGLVGSCFDTEEKREKYTVWHSKYCDLRDKTLVEKKIKGKRFSGIIHTAAKVGGVGGNMKYKGEFFYDQYHDEY